MKFKAVKKHSSSEIIRTIKNIIKGKYSTNMITASFGIRRKVQELLVSQFVRNENEKYIYGMILSSNKYFIPFNSNPETIFSGWKLHIYGEDAIDSIRIHMILRPFLIKKGFEYKIATNKLYSQGRSHNQYGKACTIYLPIVYFHNKQIVFLINLMNQLLNKMKYSR